MPTSHIQIKDILIQGNKGHRISRLMTSVGDPIKLTKDEIKASYEAGYSIVKHGDLFYQVNPNVEPSVFLIEDNASNKTYRDTLTNYFDDNITYCCDLGIVQPEPPNRLLPVFNLIESIASRTKEQRTEGSITRAITDEFTFYPSNKPFTLDEYKEIINKASEVASGLPLDIHLVLATFPVIWPDGGIHNCGLYVQSPVPPNTKALVHHFSKKVPHPNDPIYKKSDGTIYINRADSDNPNYSPNILLKDTEAYTNDGNQYGSALKVARSDGKEFIVSLGICFDHGNGVERAQVHQLINQLQADKKDVPLLCNHVITSATVGRVNEHILSTVTHADTHAKNRRPSQNQIPGRSGFVCSTISSSFSGELGAEVYPQKRIGTLHSDLFQHASASQVLSLNIPDEDGNTMLHQVFLESEFDRDLIARRLYSMVVNGGDPNISNALNQTVLDLAEEIDKTHPDKRVSKAISSALEWRNHCFLQNQISAVDGFTPLTRAIRNNGNINGLILSGSNPYLKDGSGKSAMDLIDDYDSEDLKKTTKNTIDQALMNVQYGYIRDGVSPTKLKENGGYLFPGYIPESLNVIDLRYVPGEGSKDLFFNLKLLDDAIKLYPIVLNEKEITQIKYESILKALSVFKNIVLASTEIKLLLYDSIRFGLLKDKIELPEMDENQSTEALIEHLISAMTSEFFNQWKNNLVELISNTTDLSNLLEFLSVEERSTVFELVKDKFVTMIESPKDLMFLSNLSQAERSIVFELVKDKLRDTTHSTTDLNIIKFFLPEERSIWFELVKDKLRDMTHSTTDLDIIKFFLPEERSIWFELVKDKLVGDMLINNFAGYLFNAAYFLQEEVMITLESISEESWNDIRDSGDISCDNLIDDLSKHPQAFLMIFEKMQPTFLSEAESDHKSCILKNLSESSPAFLASIKEEVLPKLIGNFSLRGLNKPDIIKELISKTFPSDNYDEFKLFLSGLDNNRREIITKSIKNDLNMMFNIPPASIQMKKDLQNIMQRKPKETQEKLTVVNPSTPRGRI